MTTSPVLFLVFNRPDTTERVFEAIRRAKPPRLYVAADGPRTTRENEASLCEATRQIATKVDWPCEVHTLFRTENLGCKVAVSSAIDWFFDHEPEGMILEDDCLPEPSFFPYCDELLAKYRDDERVGMISGDNFISRQWQPEESYYFSKINHIWGWASWRRAWAHYDVNVSNWPTHNAQKLLRKVFPRCKQSQRYWQDQFDKVHLGEIDTWDYQWTLTCFAKAYLSCMPKVNLITNIGFGANATHTTSAESKLANLATAELALPLVHPLTIQANTEADQWTMDEVFDVHHLYGFGMKRMKASARYRLGLLTKMWGQ